MDKCGYNFEFKEGNYFWDKNNQRLIKYMQGADCSYAENKTYIAFAIPLNEDILEALGFKNKGKAEYSNDNITISIDATCIDGILKCFDKTIHFVSDLQNICTEKKHELNIDEAKLEQICKTLL